MSNPSMPEIVRKNVLYVSPPPRGAQVRDDIKNCPCCHKPAYVVTKPKSFSDNGIRYYYIGCSGCSVRTALSSDLEMLIEDWNTRHEPEEIPEWLKKEIETMRRYALPNLEYANGFHFALDRLSSLKKPEDSS